MRIALPILCMWMLTLVSATLPAQVNPVAFEQLDSLKAEDNRHVVVFIHTDWCKVCHRMELTTFANTKVADKLNSDFYFVSLNAESTEPITYLNHTFRFRPTGNKTGVHELAEQLGTIDGQLNYPTVAILNENNEIVFAHGGLLDAAEMLAVLQALQP